MGMHDKAYAISLYHEMKEVTVCDRWLALQLRDEGTELVRGGFRSTEPRLAQVGNRSACAS
jgi:hypothetical protein